MQQQNSINEDIYRVLQDPEITDPHLTRLLKASAKQNQQRGNEVQRPHEQFSYENTAVETRQPAHQTGESYRGQEYAEQEYAEQEYAEQDYADQDYGEQDYGDQEYGEQEYAEQEYAEQEYPEQEYAEQEYAEQDYAEQEYPEQEYAEYAEQEYAEQDYAEQDYAEQDYAEQEYAGQEAQTTPENAYAEQPRPPAQMRTTIRNPNHVAQPSASFGFAPISFSSALPMPLSSSFNPGTHRPSEPASFAAAFGTSAFSVPRAMPHQQAGHQQTEHQQMGHPQTGHQAGHPQTGHQQTGHPQTGHQQKGRTSAGEEGQQMVKKRTRRRAPQSDSNGGGRDGSRPSLSVLTLNLNRNPENVGKILHLIKKVSPDLVCLQEVTSEMFNSIKSRCVNYKIFQIFIEEGNSYGTCILCSRDTIEVVEPYYYDYPDSQMGRRLVGCEVQYKPSKKAQNLHILTSHLESLEDNAVYRQAQLGIVAEATKTLDNVIFAGDFNIYSIAEGANDVLLVNKFRDLWRETGMPSGLDSKDVSGVSSNAATSDGNRPKRPERIMFRSQKLLMPQSLEEVKVPGLDLEHRPLLGKFQLKA